MCAGAVLRRALAWCGCQAIRWGRGAACHQAEHPQTKKNPEDHQAPIVHLAHRKAECLAQPRHLHPHPETGRPGSVGKAGTGAHPARALGCSFSLGFRLGGRGRELARRFAEAVCLAPMPTQGNEVLPLHQHLGLFLTCSTHPAPQGLASCWGQQPGGPAPLRCEDSFLGQQTGSRI